MLLLYINNTKTIKQVVLKARDIVNKDIFEDVEFSYKQLKKALKLCAAFRGHYIDFKVCLVL